MSKQKIGLQSCIFCKIVRNELPSVEVYQDPICIVIMDIFPLSAGHVMIIPRTHAQYVEELPDSEREHCLRMTALLSKAVRNSELNAEANHWLLNNGSDANQHIPHVHFHVIPRYPKDILFLLTRLMTRFINPFNRINTTKRFKKHAKIIQEALLPLLQ